jgi:hypothetical protein
MTEVILPAGEASVYFMRDLTTKGDEEGMSEVRELRRRRTDALAATAAKARKKAELASRPKKARKRKKLTGPLEEVRIPIYGEDTAPKESE